MAERKVTEVVVESVSDLIVFLEKQIEEFRGRVRDMPEDVLNSMLHDAEAEGNKLYDIVEHGTENDEEKCCRGTIALVGKSMVMNWIAIEMLSRSNMVAGIAGEVSCFEKLVSEARDRVASMDEVDGFQDRGLPTILAAMEDGLKNPESRSGFDAFVMLSDVVERSKNSA